MFEKPPFCGCVCVCGVEREEPGSKQKFPPGKNRWRSPPPISLGLSWPLTYYSTFWGWRSQSILSLSCTPPKTNMTGWKINHEWRCISYWTWGWFHCHVSFRGCKFPHLFFGLLSALCGIKLRTFWCGFSEGEELFLNAIRWSKIAFHWGDVI